MTNQIKYYALNSLPTTPNNAGEFYFTIDGSQYISTSTSFVKISDLLFVDTLPTFGQLQKLYVHDSKLKIWSGIEYLEVGGGQEFDASQLESDISKLQNELSTLQGKVNTTEANLLVLENKTDNLQIKLESHEDTLVSDSNGVHGLKVTRHKIMFQEIKDGDWIEFDTASSVLPSVTGFKGVSASDGSSITISWTNPTNDEYIKTEVYSSKTDISNLDISELDGIATKLVDDNSTNQFVQNTNYGDTYYFKVYTSHNYMGETKYANSQVITVRAIDEQPPANVTDIKVVPANERFKLTWLNPIDVDLSKIKVVMKEGSFPTSHTDGIVIYEGTGQTVTVNNLTNNTEYFIRFFVYDINNNINLSTNMQISITPYKLQDITSLKINSNLAGTEFTLNWTNPTVNTFDSLEVYVATSDLSLKTREQCVNDGQMIYSGNSNTTTHITVPNNAYYFKVFCKHNIESVNTFSDGVSSNKKAEDKEPPSIVTNVEIKESDGKLEVEWTNPIETDLANVRLHYSLSEEINSINDGIVAYNGSGNVVTITGLENDTEYTLRFFTIDNNGNINDTIDMIYKAIPSSPSLRYYDTLTTIGANETLNGAAYSEAGYFGKVSASELFTGSELALAVGVTQGTLQNNDIEWLKFYIDGKIIFKPKKFIRHSISWDTLNNSGCVFGTKTVTKNGVTFRVRLLKGAATDPSKYTASDRGAKGSEWNRLMLPLHVNSSTNIWSYPNNVDDYVPNWRIDLTDSDLGYSNLVPKREWCQETITGESWSRVVRGGDYVTGSESGTTTHTDNEKTWCPVLEVVPPEEIEGGI